MEEKKSGNKITKIIICIAVLLVYSFGMFNIIRLLGVIDVEGLAKNYSFSQKKELMEAYIHEYYYKDVDDKTLEDGSLKGLVSSLNDPYSMYYTQEEYESFNISTSAMYAGIGAALTKDPDTNEVYITYIYDNTPSQEAGLRVGDTIVSVNGTLGISQDLDSFVHLIRGEEGTVATLVYRRDGVEESVDVTRRQITLPSVFHEMIDDETGYLQITSFASNTENEFKEAMDDLMSQGMKYVIYDLRSNPGGYVTSVTTILDMILPEGTTVYMEDKAKNRTTYTSDEENQIDIPSVVLVDESTASSSEIFAGAIRDYDWGVILGTTTTGKGVVQNVTELPDHSAIRLTISEYFTPKGTSINQVGIVPDIEMEYEYDYPDDEDSEYEFARDKQVVKALMILENGEYKDY